MVLTAPTDQQRGPGEQGIRGGEPGLSGVAVRHCRHVAVSTRLAEVSVQERGLRPAGRFQCTEAKG